MLGIGWVEIVLIIVLSIVLLKPSDLRQLLRQLYQLIDLLGDYFGYIRQQFRQEIEQGQVPEKLTFKQFRKNHYSQQAKTIKDDQAP